MNDGTQTQKTLGPDAHGQDEKRASRGDRMRSGFSFVERGLLIVIALMTLAATAIEISTVISEGRIALADILLMFLYLEVIGMIAAFYEGDGSPFVYPIFIAITALARLIVLQGKDMAPEKIAFEAGAVLLLSIAAVIVVRGGPRGR